MNRSIKNIQLSIYVMAVYGGSELINEGPARLAFKQGLSNGTASGDKSKGSKFKGLDTTLNFQSNRSTDTIIQALRRNIRHRSCKSASYHRFARKEFAISAESGYETAATTGTAAISDERAFVSQISRRSPFVQIGLCSKRTAGNIIRAHNFPGDSPLLKVIKTALRLSGQISNKNIVTLAKPLTASA